MFCLYPHQTRYVVPASRGDAGARRACRRARAILAGTVETAVNAVWDAAPHVGDRIAVVGAGMVGASVARVLAGFPADAGAAGRRRRGEGRRSPPRSASSSPPRTAATGGCDLVVHASATEAGLATSLELLAAEGTVVELSWYGDRRVERRAG